MAEKDYKPYPSVGPEFKPTPSIHETFPEVRISNAVGEALKIVGEGTGVLGRAYQAVGESYGKLGRSTEGAGSELFQRAEALKSLEIDKEVDQATLKNFQVQGQNTDEFLKLQGDQVTPDVLKAHMKNAEESRQTIENSLGSEEAKKRYRGESRSTAGIEMRRMAAHAAQQQKNAFTGATEAKIEMYRQQAGRSDNPTDFNDSLNKGEELIRNKLGPFLGLGPDETQQRVDIMMGKAYADQAQTIMDKQGPSAAMKFLDENGDKIKDPRVYEQIYHTVSAAKDDRDARAIGDRATADPDKSIEDQENIARKLAEDLRPGDLKFRDQAVGRTRDQVAIRKQKLEAQRQTDLGTIGEFLSGRDNPSGKLPTLPEEIDVNPATKEAYGRLKSQDRDKVDKVLKANIKGGYRPTAENQARVNALWAMTTTREGLEQFRGVNLWAEEIPNSDKKALQAAQRHGAINPSVGKVISTLQNHNQLPSDLDKKGDLQNQFRGTLTQLIQQEEDRLQHPLTTEKELLEVGQRALSEVPGGGRWVSWGSVRFFEYEPSQDTTEFQNFRAGLKDEGKTEEEISFMYRYQKALQLLNKASKK
jgi:hypothetical protein